MSCQYTLQRAPNIDIFRDRALITTVPDTGSYTDFIGVRGGNGRYTYRVCEVGRAELLQ